MQRCHMSLPPVQTPYLGCPLFPLLPSLPPFDPFSPLFPPPGGLRAPGGACHLGAAVRTGSARPRASGTSPTSPARERPRHGDRDRARRRRQRRRLRRQPQRRRGRQVTGDTVFEAASLSKPVFASIVMQLAAEGAIDLTRPLVAYLPLPNPADERAKIITATHVLSHSSGWRNWRNSRDVALTADFPPGSKFSYSGEGYFFLQRVVEKLTGKGLPRLARERVFVPLGMQSRAATSGAPSSTRRSRRRTRTAASRWTASTRGWARRSRPRGGDGEAGGGVDDGRRGEGAAAHGREHPGAAELHGAERGGVAPDDGARLRHVRSLAVRRGTGAGRTRGARPDDRAAVDDQSSR